jgi:hypothetical protein
MTRRDLTPEAVVDAIARRLAAYPERIGLARRRLADRIGTIRATGATTTGHSGETGSPPPPGIHLTEHGIINEDDYFRHEYAALVATIRQIDNLERGLSTKLNRWAPVVSGRIEAADDIWCRNCLAHGHREPRHGRHANCRWCIDIKERYGVMPNRRLVDLHARGVKISDTLARRLIRHNARSA